MNGVGRMLSVLAAGAALGLGAPCRADDGEPIPGQVVLVLNPGVSLDDVRAAHPGLLLTDLRRYTPAQIHLLGVPVGQEEAYELELAGDAALVRSAEQNKTVSAPEEGTTQSLFLRNSGAGMATQAAFLDINGPGAGRVSAPVGTLVAVLDTGVAPHPRFADRLAVGGYDFIADAPEADESSCPAGSGLVGHGTYIAGLITLTDPQARILPVTVLDCNGVGSAFAVACGVYHAMDQGAGVINMSFATTIASDAVEAALADATAAGIFCVASVSNHAREVPVYPADYDGVLGVGAVDHAGGVWARAPFSDWGRSLALAAPGVAVRSTWYDGATFGYADGSGTSYSAAWVSGVCSLLRAKYGPRPPEWTADRFCAASLEADIGRPYGMGCDHRNDGIASILDAARTVCAADVNADEFVDFFDYDAFVADFEQGAPGADFNGDGFADFFDYDDFLAAFERGC